MRNQRLIAAFVLAAAGLVPRGAVAGGTSFFTVAPCRVLDTRQSGGPLGSGTPRTLSVGGFCGIPAAIQAVSFNFTVISPSKGGSVALVPNSADVTLVPGTVDFAAGKTRANNQVLALAAGGIGTMGTLQALANIPGGGTVDLVVDVNGYFSGTGVTSLNGLAGDLTIAAIHGLTLSATGNNLVISPALGPAGGDLFGIYPNPGVASVGGQPAASIAAATQIANAATSVNLGNRIVTRDGLGNFSAGAITAWSFSGDGSRLVNVNAANASQLDGLPPSAYQLRLKGGCPPGTSLVAFNADGSVACAEADPPVSSSVPNLISVLDPKTEPDKQTQITVGSITVGADGMPIIPYLYTVAWEAHFYSALNVVHCTAIDCGTHGPPLVLDEKAGYHVAMAIGSDGFPIISYQAFMYLPNLMVMHCTAVDCATHDAPVLLDGTNYSGFWPSIVIGADGLPIVIESRLSDNYLNDNLAVVHCTKIDCSENGGPVIVAVHGDLPAMMIGADGLPIVAYAGYDLGDRNLPNLSVVHCASLDCSEAAAPVTLDHGLGQDLHFIALTIGTDGMPVMSYAYPMLGTTHITVGGTSWIAGNSTIKMVRCATVDCASPGLPVRILDRNGVAGVWSGITIGADGLPVVAYMTLQDQQSPVLGVVHCTTRDCSSSGAPAVLGPAAYSPVSLTIGVDGLPVVGYVEPQPGGAILPVVAHCSSVLCGPPS